MVAQTRAVLDRYGDYREVVIDGAGHGPHLDQPAIFLDTLATFLAG